MNERDLTVFAYFYYISWSIVKRDLAFVLNGSLAVSSGFVSRISYDHIDICTVYQPHEMILNLMNLELILDLMNLEMILIWYLVPPFID